MSRTHAHACIIAPCSSRGCADVAIHHRAYAVPYDKPFLKVFKGGGISLKGQQSQLLCSSPLTLENNEIFKKSNQTIPRYTRVRVTSLRRLEKEYKNEEGKEKQRDGRNNIIFPRERTPFAIGGCTLRTENLWGSRAGTRDPSTRDEFEPGEPKRVALWLCKCMSHARATHARSLVRIPERCERAIGAEGWFPPYCAPDPSSSVSFNSPYCQVALAKFVIVSDYGHFTRPTMGEMWPYARFTNITIIFDSFLDEDFALYFEIRIVLLEYKVREREIN